MPKSNYPGRRIWFLVIGWKLVISLIVLLCPPSLADCKSINDEIENADIALCFHSLDQIDIGIAAQERGVRIPRLFKPAQLELFFASEKRKELLLVRYPANFEQKSKAQEFIKTLNFKRIVECSLSPEKIFEIRTNTERKFPEDEPDSRLYRTRFVHVIGTPDELELKISSIEPIKFGPFLTSHTIRFTREEVLSFLKQDTQRIFLHYNWSKFQGQHEEKWKNLNKENALIAIAKEGKFFSTSFHEDRAFFTSIPVLVDPVYNEFIASADMVLCFRSPNEIDIGVAKGVDYSRVPRLFTQADLIGFLNNERRRERLIAFIPKSVNSKNEIRDFLKNLKYAEIVEQAKTPDNVKNIVQECGEPAYLYKVRNSWNRNFPAGPTEVSRIRDVEIENSDEEGDIGIGREEPNEQNQNPHKKKAIYLTKEELKEFLKQDCQRKVLRLHWAKWIQVDERSLKLLGWDSRFRNIELAPDKGMFQIEPATLNK